jgi:hypothetical protein
MSLYRKLDYNAKSEPLYLAIAHLHRPTIEVQKIENLEVATQVFLSFVNLSPMSYLLARGKKLLVDYNKSHLVTSAKYFEFLWKK